MTLCLQHCKCLPGLRLELVPAVSGGLSTATCVPTSTPPVAVISVSVVAGTIVVAALLALAGVLVYRNRHALGPPGAGLCHVADQRCCSQRSAAGAAMVNSRWPPPDQQALGDLLTPCGVAGPGQPMTLVITDVEGERSICSRRRRLVLAWVSLADPAACAGSTELWEEMQEPMIEAQKVRGTVRWQHGAWAHGTTADRLFLPQLHDTIMRSRLSHYRGCAAALCMSAIP